MLISRKKLNTLVDLTDISDNALSEKLSCYGGLEVESISQLLPNCGYIVGQVLTCGQHPDADKLNICTVDVGLEVLTIVCGAPNVAAGKFVIVALVGTTLPSGITIEKRNIRGIDSTGMLCSLQEIGLEEKFVDPRYKDGIYLFEDELVVIGTSAAAALELDTTVFDLSITPNRADCLSYRGVAYEVAALFEKKIAIEHFEKKQVLGAPKAGLQIQNCLIESDGVKNYELLVFENLVVKPSPLWMQGFLIASGMRPINNIVDITNYIMLFLGQPLHAFDANKLATDTLVVRQACELELLETLDGKMRQLTPEDIIIATPNNPIALAGVMGGKSTEIDTKTTTIAVESAIFDPVAIRKTATHFNLRSDASQRFEKGIDATVPALALALAAELLAKYANATIGNKIIIAKKSATTQQKICCSHLKLENKIGVSLEQQFIQKTLENLGCAVSFSENSYTVTPPSWRLDLHTFEDIAEEVSRIYGFDKLPNILPIDTIRPVFKTEEELELTNLHRKLQAMGLQEILTYTLAHKKKATLGAYGDVLEPLEILYPLNNERTTLKTTTYSSIIEVLQYHFNRGFQSAQFYEISDLYGSNTIKKTLSFGSFGKLLDDVLYRTSVPTDFFLLKGIVSDAFPNLAVNFEYRTTTHEVFHPKLAADLYLENTYIGTIGKIHPSLAKDLAVSEQLYFGELNLGKIIDFAITTKANAISYQTISNQPNIERDLAFVMDKRIAIQTLLNTIWEYAGTDCQDIIVFDVYEGENIDSSLKSVSLKFRFNNRNQSLKNDEIDMLIQQILKQSKKQYGAIVRGAIYED
ncbi:phenylalanine tRNA synthetase beta subunit [Erysipelotrichaceae bacterium]|nr:phenylalanine tRNA synthetase beta subunit [Erysipelotrichaceae bacterium]